MYLFCERLCLFLIFVFILCHILGSDAQVLFQLGQFLLKSAKLRLSLFITLKPCWPWTNYSRWSSSEKREATWHHLRSNPWSLAHKSIVLTSRPPSRHMNMLYFWLLLLNLKWPFFCSISSWSFRSIEAVSNHFLFSLMHHPTVVGKHFFLSIEPNLIDA